MSKFKKYDEVFKDLIRQGKTTYYIGKTYADELDTTAATIQSYIYKKSKKDDAFKTIHEKPVKGSKRLTRVKEVTHPNGSITTTDSLRNNNQVSTEGMRIKTVTDLGYGAQNVRYENDDTICKDDLMEGFESMLKKYKLKKRKTKKVETEFEGALRVVLSDEHLGMDPQPEKSIFKYEYGKHQYLRSMEKVVSSIVAQQSIYKGFEVLYIDNLGDAQDGFNRRTTRGGHDLPQNMTNAEMFELFVDSKVRLIVEALESGATNKVISRFVVNDNHSGDFGLFCALAIKKIIGKMYSEDIVEVDTLERFMEIREYGNHAHILTHGKDKEYMKRGLPLDLTPTAIKFINDYLDHHEVTNKYIHVDKGDLHQLGYQRTKRFEYTNFGSLAPPSAWIQHNFGDSYSCFSTQVIPKWTNEISHMNHFLDYKKIS